jgi:hypothetical protein
VEAFLSSLVTIWSKSGLSSGKHPIERIDVFWLFLSVLLWGFVHSLLASMKAKEMILRCFGEHLARFYRLAYNL